MSINDPLIIRYDNKHACWQVLQGRETFYNERRELRTWGTAEEAEAWARAAFPDLPVKVEDLRLRL